MHNSWPLGGSVRAALVSGTLICAGLTLSAPAALASTRVNCPTDSLQTAISNAADGATLVVSGWCEDNFDIAKDITIEGTAGAVLTADDSGNVIGIGGAYTVTLKSLEITDGRAANGAGIYAPNGGALTLDHVTFDDNTATDPTAASGGGLFYVGTSLRISHCTFTNNQTEVYGDTATTADGGGAYVDGHATITDTTFSHNRAVISSDLSSEAVSEGGGLDVVNGPLTIRSSSFSSNVTRASVNSTVTDDLAATGGAGLAVDTDAVSVTVTHSTFSHNSESALAPWAGGSGGGASFGLDFDGNLTLTSDTFADNSIDTTTTGANGGTSSSAGLYVDAKTAHISRVNVTGNTLKVRAAHGLGADGSGAEIVTAHGVISKSSFSNNTVNVASAGSGAFDTAHVDGGGANLESGSPGLTVSASTFAHNTVRARSAVGGSSIEGGGLQVSVFSTGSNNDRVINSTVTRNTITVKGPSGNLAEGGGVSSSDPSLRLQFDTIAGNAASGPAKKSSLGGGVVWSNTGATPASVEGSLVLGNSAGTGPNCGGTLRSKGYNMFGSLAGCKIAHKPSDSKKVSVKKAALGKLAANGGPTKTLALGTHSTALNRVPRKTCRAIVSRDQRGVKRPQGGKCDEGAYELRVKH